MELTEKKITQSRKAAKENPKLKKYVHILASLRLGVRILSFSIFILSPVFVGAVSLNSEITRLERISANSNAAPRERFDALLSLTNLFMLSGQREAALRSTEQALAIMPGDGRALLLQSRLLISMGEFERAAVVLNSLFVQSQDREQITQGRYLSAMLEAFRTGNPQMLTVLANEPALFEYRSAIYFALWKITGQPAWQHRLTTEFPRSPEAKIASGAVTAASTPLWLLFPGRNSIQLASPPATAPAASPAATPALPQTAAPQSPVSQTPVLQTGLFSRESNARAMADNLRRAGFEPQITTRQVNNNTQWAVTVSGGANMTQTIARLREAGFEAFPVR